MGLGPCILGHSPDIVTEAVRLHADQGTVLGMTSKLELELAEKIVQACESVDQIRFTCSGTEAVMTALRVARAHTGKPAVLKFSGGYHGHADAVLARASKTSIRQKSDRVSDGIHDSVRQNTFVGQYNDAKVASDIINEHHRSLAAVIVEPIATNMGLVVPEIEFLKTLRALCDTYNIVLIFDEVVSGFRFCYGCVSQILDVAPDLTTFGKIIGGGLGIGAYGGKREVMAAVSKSGGVFQGGTFAGSPLTMAAGIAMLNAISEDGFYDSLVAKAALFASLITDGLKAANIDFSIQQYGPLATFIFQKNVSKLSDFSDVERQDADLFRCFHKEMVANGILFPPTLEEPIFFSAAHSNEDIEKAASTSVDVLSKLLAVTA